MNGSRSINSRPGDRSSLDALNRTIEGLEARLEGLMHREPKRHAASAWEARNAPAIPNAATPAQNDPLQDIRNRQRMLAANRERASASHAEQVTPPPMPRPRLEPRRPPQHAPQTASDPSLREIAEALVGLRQELKDDIAEGVAREMSALRTDVSNIRSAAQGQPIGEDLRSELARLADSINTLGQRGGPATEALRAEYAELHAVIDGLAREESIQRLDSRWQGLEERIVELDTQDLREELVGLAYRIDDIKSHLGSMSDSPAIQALEQKLLTVATAMEQLGTRMQPDQALNSQFALLDERLDEISRAIAASGRSVSASTTDHALQRLEQRLGLLAQQIDTMASTADTGHTGELSERIEALTQRIDQLSQEQVSLRLEERLDQLSHMLTTTSKPQDLTGYLADISDKIDRLDDGTVNAALAERLDHLARRIDSFAFLGPQQSEGNQSAFDRLEDRLSGIAAKLDETTQAPSSDGAALRDLEAQIAHLSSLISHPASSPVASAVSREMEDRMAALETYMTTNDEYVLEAARQAAEAVLEGFTRQGAGSVGAGAPGVDVAALTALAEDLRHIEELTRTTEERSQHTLNALHRTLVQIADRLDTMEDRIAGPLLHAPVPPTAAVRQPERQSNPAFASTAAPAVENLHHDLVASLASGTAHAAPQPAFGIKNPATAANTVVPTTEDAAVAPDEPVAGSGRSGEDAPKGGLLSQISRRLRPGQKPVASKPGRIVVDPAPPLDPVDMLPPDQENEPLEPGSGAPDVRKILERVRASQAAAGSDRAQPKDADRADYIAAARRAAKAAAREIDPTQNAPAERTKKARAGKTEAKTSSGSAFARHRRPIIMAVGAVLLVLMALPLVKTLTTGEEAPQAPAITDAPAVESGNAAPVPADEPNASLQPQSAPAAPLPEEPADDISALEEPPTETAGAGVMDGSQSTVEDAIASAQPQADATTPGMSSEAPAEPRIVVPASIGPKSLTDAAEAGDPVALFEIGSRYTDGRGVGPDLSEAANWYKLSADRGFAPAQYRIANLFEKGTGIGRDADKAIDYYRQAAEAGNASAMHNLAVLHASGANGEPDYAAAVGWFQKAAELGVSDSQFNLAILYARGNGVPQNLVESYKWFAVAAKGGDQDAAEKRDEVAKAMRKEQVDAARAAADSWKPQPLSPDANEVNLPDEWADAKPLTTASVDMEKAVLNIQAILNKNGFDAGTPDGKMGQKTVGAIKAFQASIGQEPDGRVNDALVTELLKRNT